MAETNWVSLQFDRHIQKNKDNDRRIKFIEASIGIRGKKLLESFESPCDDCLHKSDKAMDEIRKRVCNIIGSPTLKETKHKNFYLNTFY